MQITGSYNNYLNMTNLLSPLGIKGAGDTVMQVFSASIDKLQNKIDNQLFSDASTDALTQLYDGISDLAAGASKLTIDDINSVFNDRSPSSTDTSVISATAVNAFSRNTGAAEFAYATSVHQLAQAQENTGRDLNTADASVVTEGENTFNIHIDGQDHELSVEILSGDTNELALQKIADSVNDANLGITAEVSESGEEGSQKLILTSNQTGADSAFTLTNVSGNAVDAAGLNSVSRAGQDATYTVNGTDYTSGTNTVSLDDGLVTAHINDVGDAVLTVGPDEKKVAGAINDFVSELNSFIEFNQNNRDYIKEDVVSTINSYIDGHKTELAAMGITQNDEGTLSVDEEILASAVNQDMAGVKSTFSGFDGFSYQVKTYSSRISTDSPLNYAKESESMNLEFTDHLYSTSAQMLRDILQASFLDTYV